VISKDQRSEWFEKQGISIDDPRYLEQQGILINDPRYQDLLDERSLYFRPFLLKWSDVGGQVNESRWELVGAELKHIYEFTDSHRFQRFTAHGRFGGALTRAVVAHGNFYKLSLAAAKMFSGECTSESQDVIGTNVAAIEKEIPAGAANVTRLRSAYSAEVAFEAAELSKNAKEALTDLWEARLRDEGLAGEELRSLKYRKSKAIPRYKNELVADLDKENEDEDAEDMPDEDAVSDEDLIASDLEEIEPEDDDPELSEDEGSESFSDSGSETSEGICYTNDPRFSDDEDAAGPPEGHDHILPMYEDSTRKTQDPYTHEELEYVRRHADRVKKDPERRHIPPVVFEMVMHKRTPEEALEICGVDAKPKTAQKWKERFTEEAEMLKDSPDGIPYVAMSDEMLDDIKSGSAYVLLDLGNGWKYHKLDTETYATLDAAKKALKVEKILAAWKESDVRKKTKDFIKRKEELGKIRDQFDQRFEHAHTYRDPNRWPRSLNHRGLLGDLAGREG